MASTTKCRSSPRWSRWIRKSPPTSRRCSAASAALSLSGVPFAGPIGAARVGYKDGAYLLNPTPKRDRRARSSIWWSPALRMRVLMVESEAESLSEEVMLGAVVFGHEQMQVAIKAINRTGQAGGQAALGLEAGSCERRAE